MVGAEILNLEQFDSADLRETAAMSAHIDHLSVPEVDPPSMKIKELKEYLRVCGVSIAGVTEKSELIALAQKAKEDDEKVGIKRHAPSQVEPTAPPPAAGGEASGTSGGGGGGGTAGGFGELLGPTLLTKEGEKPTAELLAGAAHVLLYFSAHWCPPCRGYTPQLSQAYAASAKAGKETAIVFISSDRDQASFDEYYGEMTFYALPFAASGVKEALSAKYSVQGIPTLIALDGSCGVVDASARGNHADYL